MPYSETIKAVLSDKMMMFTLLFFLITSLAGALKTNITIYYCNYVLGTYADGVTQTMLNAIGGIPMGIGVFVVWPLAKKIGKRNCIMLGMIIEIIGGFICIMAPTNMTIVLIGQFIKNMGARPSAYVFMALFADLLDHLEWKHGFRSDGIAMSIYSTITVVLTGVSIGVLNVVLSHSGYIKPFSATSDNLSQVLDTIKEAGYSMQLAVDQLKPTMDGVYTIALNQNTATNNAMIFLFVGLEIITCAIGFILLLFVNVEKDIDEKQKVIKERLEK